MKKWNLVIDLDKCNGCFNCFLSTKDEHVGNAFPGYAAAQPLHGHEWIGIKVHERGTAPTMDLTYLPVMCNHCDNAPCVKAGKGAVTKRADGIVIIDPDKARGRRDLVDACPYGAIWWNEQEQLPQAWIFDAHLLDQGWPQPRCAQSCGTGAMRAVKVDDLEMQRLSRHEGLEVLRPELKTQPRVHYRNLHRATSVFVAGTIIATKAGVSDTLVDASVSLLREGSATIEVKTDAFGEFRIDRLPPRSGNGELRISADGMQTVVINFELIDDSICIGTVELSDMQGSALAERALPA